VRAIIKLDEVPCFAYSLDNMGRFHAAIPYSNCMVYLYGMAWCNIACYGLYMHAGYNGSMVRYGMACIYMHGILVRYGMKHHNMVWYSLHLHGAS